MSKLSWITVPGPIAQVYSGISITLEIQAFDVVNLGFSIAYKVIKGSLPPGMTLSSTGVLSGTPTYIGLENAQTYGFTVRAVSKDLAVLDGDFSITVVASIGSKLVWLTPSGNLGTVPSGEYYNLPLVAESTDGSSITYSFVSGQLPPGMQIVNVSSGSGSVGQLSGVPTITSPLLVDQSINYRFTARATSSTEQVRDQAFNISITNVQAPVILPSTQLLGNYFDGTYYNQQLSLNEIVSNTTTVWSLVEGSLPPGLSLSNTGLLSGFIEPIQSIGQYGPSGFDGGVNVGQTVMAGNFTVGDSLTITTLGNTDFTALGASTNTIGTIFTATAPGFGTGTATYNINNAFQTTQQQEFDYGPYDFTNISQSQNYTFTVQAYDGANYSKQTYTISILGRNGWTTDTSNLVNDTNITVDTTNIYVPVITNASTTLPVARQNGYYAFKIQAYDYQGDTVSYSITDNVGTFDAQVFGQDNGFDSLPFDDNSATQSLNNANLPGLVLDPYTGWIYGIVGTQSQPITQYSFSVTVSKVHTGPVYWTNNNTTTFTTITATSKPTTFNLVVLGDVNNTVNWITPTNLGTIANGTVSELYILAESTEGLELVYSLVDAPGISCALPQGLSLLSDGTISGRVSFETFTIDQNATTFDNNTCAFDHIYNFYAQAQTPNGASTIIQNFTIQVTVKDPIPYVNVYLHSLPIGSERAYYNQIISNSEIFSTSCLYRPQDPWYGVQNQLSILFLSGLKPDLIDQFESAMTLNHYNKTYNFGEIKTAVVLDENFNTKYEVVYVEVLDPEETLNSTTKKYVGPGLELNLTNQIQNGYIDSLGNEHYIVYPNTTNNMQSRLISGVGYLDQSTLPPWMTSNQLPASQSNSFSPPLGFTRAVVLAYTKPNCGELIAYRLKNAGVNFNQIEFKVDRYELDNYYARNFDTTSKSFITDSKETTFDLTPTQIGSIVAVVNYAVDIPFDQINGRTRDYINSRGGIDGWTSWQDGDTLIFYTQEHFLGSPLNDGWVSYQDAYIGNNIATTVQGYDSEPFDSYYNIPGYLTAISSTTILTGDGVKTRFQIVQNVTNSNQVSVYVNGVLQNPTTYVVSGSVLEFSFAPANVIPAPVDSRIVVYNGSNIENFSGNGTQTQFILNPSVSPPTSILLNGVVQSTANYSVTTTAVTAGSFVVGQTYSIASLGTGTDWANIGVGGTNSAVSVGTTFTASNIGSGTGTAQYSTLTFATAPPLIQPSPIGANIQVISNGPLTSNQRGGVWKINILGGVVSLSSLQIIQPNQRVFVLSGKSHNGSVAYYTVNTSGTNNNEPYYTTVPLTVTQLNHKTTFNNNTTRFFSYRDQYYTPNSQDKYIKFPQYGVFD
jgi:hypothetical protein